MSTGTPFVQSTTELERAFLNGDDRAAETLFALLYRELRTLAAQCVGDARGSAPLQPTSLVHEAFLRLRRQGQGDWHSRRHFWGVAAKAMRSVLIDHARRRRRQTHRDQEYRLLLHVGELYEQSSIDLLVLDEALTRLAQENAALAQLVELLFFVGVTHREAAQCLGLSERTVERRWQLARAWLRRETGAERSEFVG